MDAFASILTDRLTWVRQNQDSIRMIKANGLLDAAAHDASGADIGVSVILPHSFTGAPRQMHRSYLDAMALARYSARPTTLSPSRATRCGARSSASSSPASRLATAPTS